MIKTLVQSLCLSLLCLTSAFAATDGPATLPKIVYSVSPTANPTPGAVIAVTSGQNLQTDINAANCGDVLSLQAGATFTGTFTLPAKSCDDLHYIRIRTSSPDNVNGMPGPGIRITPCRAGVKSLPGRPAYPCANPLPLMSKLIAPKASGPITLAAGANHYILGPGLEITRPVGTGIDFNLIAPSGAADHIIIDRDWVHGTAQDETTRGVFLSGTTSVAVVNSYFSDFHCIAGIGTCVDSQAVSGGSGSLAQGNWNIQNNFLEAAAENILFGGTKNNSVTPADITIRHNHLFKPLTWMSGHAGFVGGKDTTPSGCPSFDPAGGGQCPFIVKNGLEFKNAQRVLVESNIIEDSWAGFTQHGGTVLIEGANTCATPTYSSVSVVNVTLRYNKVAHAASGPAITNPGDVGVPNCPISNISMHDNVFDDLNANVYGDSTGTWDNEYVDCSVCVPFHDISVVHNTEIVTATKKMFLVIGASFSGRIGINLSNNLVIVNSGVQVGGGYPAGTPLTNTARLNYLFSNPIFTGNVLVGGTADLWPAGNFFPALASDVGFTNYNNGNGGNYTLALTSTYKGKGSDGKDPGANVAAVVTTTSGVQ